MKLLGSILITGKQNYVVNTEEILSLAMESVILLGHTNYLNNIRREKIKCSLHEDLQTCENGNPPTKFILGSTFHKGSRRQKIPENSYFNPHRQQDLVVGQHLLVTKINIHQQKRDTKNIFCDRVRNTN